MAHELDVWLFADHVGRLCLVEGRLNFSYAPAWLAQPNAIALSSSLPLQAEPFDDQRSRPFFAGLLPEGQMRRLIAQQFQISGHNDFALLDHIGGECAGAVTFAPPGQALPLRAEADDVQWLTDDDVVALLDELPSRPMLAGQDGLRLSLAGVQDKLPVVFDEQRIGLPRRRTPSSHILKPAIHAVEDSTLNEGFCMALAGAMQLKPARSKIHVVLNRPFLLVERYDRLVDASGSRLRLHQEDFCQALGVVPEMKYQNECGPDLARCFELVRRVTRPSAPHVLRLFDGVIFNALIGNHDAHAKNFSLLYRGPQPELAPLYDLLCTAAYPQLSDKMAMKIGSRYRFSQLLPRHWQQLAQSAGLSWPQVRLRLQRVSERLPRVAERLQAQPPFSGTPMVQQITSLIGQRCALTQRRLADPPP